MPLKPVPEAAIERRITLRLIAYWERLRAGRAMPEEINIDPEDLSDLWDHCFLVQVRDLQKKDYNYTYLGTAIMDAYRGGLSVDDSGSIVTLNANKLAGNYAQVMETCKPVIDEGEFENAKACTVKYRQCLLPLGKDGVVDAIFGGMRYKIFPHD